MSAVRFTILGEPASLKNSRKLVSFGRGDKKRPGFIKSEKAREYERTAALQIPAHARQMLEGPLAITIHIYYTSNRSDLDESGILDVLQAKYARAKGKLEKIGVGQYREMEGERVLVSKGCYVNDRQIKVKHIFHHLDKVAPRAEIEIEPLEMQQESMPLDVLEKEGNPF